MRRIINSIVMIGIILSTLSGYDVKNKQQNKKAMFRANQQHTGVYYTKGVPKLNGIKWKYKIKEKIRSSPVVMDRIIYFGCLYAVDKETGKEWWRPGYGANLPSTPCVYKGSVISASGRFMGAEEFIEAHEVWFFETEGSVYSSPVVADGMVYFGSDDGYFYALDADTRELRPKAKWHFKTGDKVFSSPVIANGVVYFGSDDGYLYALH